MGFMVLRSASPKSSLSTGFEGIKGLKVMVKFNLKKFETTPKVEILAGIATFLTSAYIIVVNPSILSVTGAPFPALLTATVLVSMISTIGMGLYANNPLLLAPGMGINAFFSYTLVLGMNIPYETALGAVFWSGIIFIFISVFKVRELIVESIPLSLQRALSCGIGFFIAFIGLKNGGLITKNPETLVAMGKLDVTTLTFLAGFFITSIFVLRGTLGGMLLGVVCTTLMAIPIGRWWGEESQVIYQGFFATPDFSLFLKLDFLGSLKFAYIPILFTLFFTDLFESLSTFVGVSQAGGLVDKKGRPLRIKKSLLVDALGTTLSGLLGTSPATSYVESAVGVQQGGRTGLVSLTAGLLFLPFLFLSPLLSTVPAIATAPPLILAGVAMMNPIKSIEWDQMDEAIPAFLAIILMPLTFSIANGITYSFLAYTLCKLANGKASKIPKVFYIVNFMCLLLLFT